MNYVPTKTLYILSLDYIISNCVCILIVAVVIMFKFYYFLLLNLMNKVFLKDALLLYFTFQ